MTPLRRIVVTQTFLYCTDADFNRRASITVEPPGPRACIDFTDLVVNDNIAVEGDEAFQIAIEGTSSMAMVTIIDDDGKNSLTTVAFLRMFQVPLLQGIIFLQLLKL